MEDYELKKRLAESLREAVFKIPRRNREYEMLLQPMLQVSDSGDMINIRFSLKYKKGAFPCRMRVETDGAYVHVARVGAYLNNLFIKGKPDAVCSEFVKWMKFARNGTIEGNYAFMFHYDRPVGFMVKPSDRGYSYAFFAKEIEECGLKPKKVLELYSEISYDKSRITCRKMEEQYLPQQVFGKGLKPVSTLDLETKRRLIWSMMCICSSNNKKS